MHEMPWLICLFNFLAWATEARTIMKLFHRLQRWDIMLDHEYLSAMGSEIDVRQPLIAEQFPPARSTDTTLPSLPAPATKPPKDTECFEMKAECKVPKSHAMHALPALNSEIYELNCLWGHDHRLISILFLHQSELTTLKPHCKSPCDIVNKYLFEFWRFIVRLVQE